METPFLLAFGTKAVIPIEIGVTIYRMTSFNPEKNDEYLKNNLDVLKEKRDKVALRIAAYKNRMAKYYNLWVKPRKFTVGDVVLKKVSLVTEDPTKRKLKPS